jgi:hypothetical protein
MFIAMPTPKPIQAPSGAACIAFIERLPATSHPKNGSLASFPRRLVAAQRPHRPRILPSRIWDNFVFAPTPAMYKDKVHHRPLPGSFDIPHPPGQFVSNDFAFRLCLCEGDFVLFILFGESAMTIARYILAIAVLLFAAYVVVINWGCVIVSMRNKRRGIDRHHSTVPIFSFGVTVVAMIIYPRHDRAVWMFSVPLVDIANWSLLWLPFGLIRECMKKGTEPGASPNGGPAKPSVDSSTSSGPPSVS